MSVSLQWVTVVVMVWRQVSAYMTPLTGIALSQLSQEKISYLNLQRSDHSLIVDHWYQIQSFESSITSLKLLLRKRIILPRMLWHYLVESWAFCGCGYNRADCYNVKYRPETWDKTRTGNVNSQLSDSHPRLESVMNSDSANSQIFLHISLCQWFIEFMGTSKYEYSARVMDQCAMSCCLLCQVGMLWAQWVSILRL